MLKRESYDKMNIEVFYHICAKSGPDALNIIEEQLFTLRNSELYEIVNQINCCLVGDDSFNFFHLFQKIPRYGDKFKISKTGFNDKTYERFTLNYMREKVVEDGLYLYLHSKGVTKVTNENIKDWRRCMEFFLIKNSKKCIDKLNEGYDTVGTMKHPTAPYPHYSGNFWWASGRYLKKLFDEKQITNDYSGPEMYVLSNNPKAYDFYGVHHINPNYNGYYHRLPESSYVPADQIHLQDRYVHVYGIAGLGNSIYQICAAIYYCEKYGYKLQLVDTFELNYGTSLLQRNKIKRDKNGAPITYRYTLLNHPNLPFISKNNYTYNKVIHNDNYTVRHIVPEPSDKFIVIQGFGQHVGVFKEIKDKILNYFNLYDKNSYEYIQNKYHIDPKKKNIMVGIRIGNDFKHMTKITSKSYENALKRFVKEDESDYNLIVLSDDVNYHHMLNFKINGNIIVVNEDDITQMYAGMICNHFILCESTYHYWIAFFKELMEPTVKIIYFNDTDMTKYSRVLESWIGIDYQ
jgi:hypothetical protein